MVFSLALNFSGECCNKLPNRTTGERHRIAQYADIVLAIAAVALAILHLTGTLSFLPPAASYIIIGAGSITLLHFASWKVRDGCLKVFSERKPKYERL